MTYKVTPKQLQNIQTAIQRAKSPGGCAYTSGGVEPECVIGQLASLEGVPQSTLEIWEGSINRLRRDEQFEADLEPLAGYETDLLEQIQRLWDGAAGVIPPPTDYPGPAWTEQVRAEMLHWVRVNVEVVP